MADAWVGLCDESMRGDVERALRFVDARGRLTFASSPEDLRERMHEIPFCTGAIVGPYSGAISPLNVAAALAHDAVAADVALVVPKATSGLEERARQAGVRTVIDLSVLSSPRLADLDEPVLADDDVPTMVFGAASSRDVSAQLVPSMDGDSSSELITLPLLRGGKDGPKVESITIPRGLAASDSSAATPAAAVSAHHGKPSRDGAPIITFVSGRGGVGKTSLVAMMGTIASSWGLRVALCDLDLSGGNLYSCFEFGAMVDLAELVRDRLPSPDEILSYGRDLAQGLKLWGPCELPEMGEAVYPAVKDLLEVLAQHHDLVLVDTSTTFTDAVAQAAQQCDRLVITVDDRPGMPVSQARIAALAVRLGVARTRLVRLANKCGPHGKGEPIINRAEVGLETVRPLRVLDGGAEVVDSLSEGRVNDLLELESRFAESCASSLAVLLSELGKLPDTAEAHRAFERRGEKPRWSFGRRREAM